MSEYYVSDGNGGKAVPIPVKQDPFASILNKQDAPKSPEKPKDDPVAGDDTVAQSKTAFEGKEEGVVPDKEKEVIYGHCNNCRLELTEEKVVKTPIDYARAEDGTLTKAASRFSIFCKSCMKFITLIDNDAQKMLNEMIRKGIR